MRFYGSSYQDVRRMPIRTFWTLSKQIDRVAAEEDLRRLELMALVAGGDANSIKDFRQTLIAKIGEIATGVVPDLEPELDQAGLDQLRMMGRMAR